MTADLGAFVRQHGDVEAVALLEDRIAFDIDRAHGHAELGRERRKRPRHILAEVAVGTMIKGDLHTPEG